MRSAAFLAAISLTACGGGTQSDDSESARSVDYSTQALSSACSGCHAPGGSAISDLSGWTEAALLASMQFYRNDSDGTSVMHRLARGYTEDEMSRIAVYLSQSAGEAE